jgi:hypothetical protein
MDDGDQRRQQNQRQQLHPRRAAKTARRPCPNRTTTKAKERETETGQLPQISLLRLEDGMLLAPRP